MKKILYFDCFAGISGDMTIGALLDLGVDQKVLRDQLNSLNVAGYSLKIENKSVKGIQATDFDVIIEHPSHHKHDHHDHHHHRNLDTILGIIEKSDLEKEAKQLSSDIFNTVAKSEAKIHGKEIDEVHFHEVGAIDSIVDIVGAAVCLSYLKPDKVYSSPLHVGSGTVNCAHGILPVPAPATADILKGIPIYSTDVIGELVTPTGAAIIKTISSNFGPLPSMEIDEIGYGAGNKDFNIPNILRVLIGKEVTDNRLPVDKLVMLETNIDDMNPETFSHLFPLLFEKGALDVFTTSVMMKKGRPGVLLNVLCKNEDVYKFEDLIFKETTTLGIRKSAVDRSFVERDIIQVETQYGAARAKLAKKDGQIINIAPEYEDCHHLARKHNVSLTEIYDAVRAKARG